MQKNDDRFSKATTSLTIAKRSPRVESVDYRSVPSGSTSYMMMNCFCTKKTAVSASSGRCLSVWFDFEGMISKRLQVLGEAFSTSFGSAEDCAYFTRLYTCKHQLKFVLTRLLQLIQAGTASRSTQQTPQLETPTVSLSPPGHRSALTTSF